MLPIPPHAARYFAPRPPSVYWPGWSDSLHTAASRGVEDRNKHARVSPSPKDQSVVSTEQTEQRRPPVMLASAARNTHREAQKRELFERERLGQGAPLHAYAALRSRLREQCQPPPPAPLPARIRKA